MATLSLPSDNREGTRKIQAWVHKRLAEQGLNAEIRLLINPGLSTLAWLVQTHEGEPLVFPCSGNLFQGEGLYSLVGELAHPVLLVK